MPMKSLPSLCLAALASCLFSSCGGIAWNLAGYVHERPDSCTGVDITHPVEGQVYRAKDNAHIVVMLAPEVSYNPCSHIVASGDWVLMERLTAQEVKPTGKNLWVQLDTRCLHSPGTVLPGKPEKVEYTETVWILDERGKTEVITPSPLEPDDASSSLPLERLVLGNDGVNPKGIIHTSTTRGAWGPLASVASVPLFVADCALGVATNTAGIACALALSPITAPLAVYMERQKQKEPPHDDTAEPVPAAPSGV